MKKFITVVLCVAAAQFTMKAAADKPISFDQIPAGAQSFVTDYFGNLKVAYANVDNDGMVNRSYDVVFTNGNKIEFDRDGAWTEIDCKYTGVPAGVVPQRINDYVVQNYPDVKILKIERDARDYEVKLGNGLELTFDLNYNLIKIDD